MPTGAKLVGAVLFFGIGWYGALQALLTVPEGTQAVYFPLIIALIGLGNGWMVVGTRAGGGLQSALANGLRTSVQIAFFGLLFMSLKIMFERSANLRYGGFGEAIGDATNEFIGFFFQTLTIEVWGVLFVGGIVGGLLTEWAGRAWR